MDPISAIALAVVITVATILLVIALCPFVVRDSTECDCGHVAANHGFTVCFGSCSCHHGRNRVKREYFFRHFMIGGS